MERTNLFQPEPSGTSSTAGVADNSLTALVAAVDRQTDEDGVINWGLEAVKDIQGTIRAIDSKIGILLAALAFPLKDVAQRFIAVHEAGFAPSSVVFSMAICAYAIGVILSVLTLTGIGGSHFHAKGATDFNTFYAGGLFPLNFMDAFISRKNVHSRMTVEDFSKKIPQTCNEMLLDISAEIMQLAYIRDLKILRQRYAFLFTGGAFFLGAIGFALLKKTA